MQEKRRENKYRNTLVCIDRYDGRIMEGQLVNPGTEQAIPFYGAVQFFREMEQLLDDMQFPESFSKMRSFLAAPPEPPDERTEFPQSAGQLATFNLRVLFRQNASWQGSVSWLEGGRDETFRSALELLLLMDSALSHL